MKKYKIKYIHSPDILIKTIEANNINEALVQFYKLNTTDTVESIEEVKG